MAAPHDSVQPLARTIEVTRRARYHLLGEPGAVSQLWYVLHGYGQLASGFAREFEPLVTSSRAFVAPEGLSRHYREGGRGRSGLRG